MKIFQDERIVLTLDAGGTNFVFSALKGGKPITPLITLPSNSTDLEKCLENIIEGFKRVKKLLLPEKAVAISFAFPGPAEYEKGIIISPPNFPSFKEGVALGPMLEDYFNLPTYINNDGDLFTYGEAIGGFLPEVNNGFKEFGIKKEFKNLIGITLGTGFGAGVVINQEICAGDNSAGGEIWLMRNLLEPKIIAEESVSVRGIQSYYKDYSKESFELSPKDIFQIAVGDKNGNREAAVMAYDSVAKVAAEALANVMNIIDGGVVIGGGIAGSSKLLLPQILEHLNGKIENRNKDRFNRIVSQAFSFEEQKTKQAFYKTAMKKIKVPFSTREIEFVEDKRVPVGISRLGTNNATMLGAYAVALSKSGRVLEKKEKV
ncbi:MULTISPECIES: ROK family protein [Salegentibacter]|jgi:glucokinase|uniref:Glucokinase n=1 Tax=Salegentibacter agarivorans TaxID=345907 RepID=A0A1I2LV78_9FLAO|nr:MULTISPECIES: ROK family protein [Salegentibacter]APS37743.1 ROK family transcriptional regulator [Salegentibacter sp. T436]SFF83165.1 glucokinase [Salegentibacter agarivorans]|tara:strand:- start:1718 stop:2842 length:1125 start_codon:yes stop_codon:yes gene_type:complete